MATEIKVYPEHDKLHAIKDKSQAVGEFIEWLSEQGIVFCSMHDHVDECENKDGNFPRYTCGVHEDEYMPVYRSREKMLAEFFGIDIRKIDAEKTAMLAELSGRDDG